MTPIKGILFDKDGTLLDFFETWMPAFRAAARVAADLAGDSGAADKMLHATGLDRATGALDPSSLLAGGTTAEVCEAWAEIAGVADKPLFKRRVHAAMDDHVAASPVPVAEGLDQLFARLAGRGFALGIATMDSEAVARTTAERLGLSPWLIFLAGYDSGHGAKPGPGMVQGFCKAAGVRSAEVLVVGDTDRDMGMARNAGAGLAVGVLTGASPADYLARIADAVLESVFDLEAFLPESRP